MDKRAWTLALALGMTTACSAADDPAAPRADGAAADVGPRTEAGSAETGVNQDGIAPVADGDSVDQASASAEDGKLQSDTGGPGIIDGTVGGPDGSVDHAQASDTAIPVDAALSVDAEGARGETGAESGSEGGAVWSTPDGDGA